MVAPAPLDTIREKLASPTEAVRMVALWHARAHGAAARPLAPDVARCFEDESPVVAWHAMGAFMEVGAGSAEAVPVLRAQLAKGTPDMLVRRALSAFEVIGPAAIDALPDLLARDAVDAVLAIAPDDPRVRAHLVARVLAGDLSHLSHVPECVDAILARTDGHQLRELKEYRPDIIVQRAVELLDSEDHQVVMRALRVVEGSYTPKLAVPVVANNPPPAAPGRVTIVA